MSPEEKIPEEPEFTSPADIDAPSSFAGENMGDPPELDSDVSENESPVDASLLQKSDSVGDLPQATIVEASLVTPVKPPFKQISPPPITANLDNIAANGGAVGAIVLGIWSLIGAFITNWSIINGVLGLLLGFWGLTSRRRKMAWVGIVLCLISIFLSLIQVGELVNTYMNPVDENPL